MTEGEVRDPSLFPPLLDLNSDHLAGVKTNLGKERKKGERIDGQESFAIWLDGLEINKLLSRDLLSPKRFFFFLFFFLFFSFSFSFPINWIHFEHKRRIEILFLFPLLFYSRYPLFLELIKW